MDGERNQSRGCCLCGGCGLDRSRKELSRKMEMVYVLSSQTSGLNWSSRLSLPTSWDYCARHCDQF
jgi:hypothetical protein